MARLRKDMQAAGTTGSADNPAFPARRVYGCFAISPVRRPATQGLTLRQTGSTGSWRNAVMSELPVGRMTTRSALCVAPGKSGTRSVDERRPQTHAPRQMGLGDIERPSCLEHLPVVMSPESARLSGTIPSFHALSARISA